MTDSQNDTDAEPTPGPWKASIIEKQGAFVDGPEQKQEIASMSVPGKEGIANARLIAAAGNAAHDLPDGVDPLDAIRALPELIEAARSGSYSAVMDALASAEGSEE